MTDTAAPAAGAPEEGSAEPTAEIQPGHEPAAAQPKVERYRFKVDGQEIEADLEELKKGYGRAKSANKKYEEAAKLRKQADGFIEQLRRDPRKVLSDPRVGVDLKKIAMQIVLEEAEAEILSPQERAAKQEKEELQRYRETEKQRQQREQSELEERQADEHGRDIAAKLADALKAGTLPGTKTAIRRAAGVMRAALEKDFEPDMADVAQLVEEEVQTELRTYCKDLDGDALVRFLGDDVANKIRKHDLARIRGVGKNQQETTTQKDQATPPRREKTAKTMNAHEAASEFRRRLGLK